MKVLQRSGLIAISVLLTILLVACGGTTNQGPTANTTNQGTNNNNATNNQNMPNGMPTANATPTTNGTPMATATPMNNGNTMTGITITPSMTGNMAAFIHTGKAAINGQTVDLLLTNKNFAVYYYKPDTTFKATCTGQCAQDWPPVLAPQGMMTVSSSMALPKQLSVRQTANGTQVFYDGHALYTYAADKQAANALGRGEDMQWYLVGFQL